MDSSALTRRRGWLSRPGTVYLLAALLMPVGMVWATPTVPQRDDLVLEMLPRRNDDPLDARIFQQTRALSTRPKDLELAEELARLHLDRFRRDADPRDLGQAEAVLAPWLAHAAPPETLVLRASVRQSNHFFQAALDDLSAALRMRPGDAQALIIRASILQVQGRFDEARRSCAALIVQDSVAAGICLANVAAVSGHVPQALAVLRSLARQVPPGGALQNWLLTSEAETLHWSGDYVGAEQVFHTALAANPRDAYLKTAWADFLLDRGRAREVMILLAADERNDNLLLRLALAERQAGVKAALAPHVRDLASRFAASAQRGDHVHMREEARFHLELLDDPKGALTLAEANWQVQKEVADCRILLAAALAAHEPRRGLPALDWYRVARLGDPVLAGLAARVAAAAGVSI